MFLISRTSNHLVKGRYRAKYRNAKSVNQVLMLNNKHIHKYWMKSFMKDTLPKADDSISCILFWGKRKRTGQRTGMPYSTLYS
ncbi:hypothetical protein DN757_10075 [Paenibacillus silvae]|uniref:Uncharacterized protein n=1 Tax=Paenibacillus silvae TaxID=1325358 RepID=A0A2W6P7Y5_9BACL|nr:hypothetical protein DN757_10075 [Paenibacillus silvae]